MTGIVLVRRWWVPALYVLGTALLLLLGFARAAEGQPLLADGTRIRVTLRSTSTPVIGRVHRGDPPWLGVDSSAMQRVDVSRGYRSRKWMGAGVGGAISSAAFISLACALSNGSCDPRQDVGGFLAYVVVGAVPGALLGGAIGAHVRGDEQWRVVWTRPPSPPPATPMIR